MTETEDARARGELLRAAMQILDAWGVAYDEQPVYLGLPPILRLRDYNRYRLGALQPENESVFERARLIKRIHEATLTLFPYNERSANLWVQVPQRYFGGQSALDVMRKRGIEGMRQVDLAIDNQFDPLLN